MGSPPRLCVFERRSNHRGVRLQHLTAFPVTEASIRRMFPESRSRGPSEGAPLCRPPEPRGCVGTGGSGEGGPHCTPPVACGSHLPLARHCPPPHRSHSRPPIEPPQFPLWPRTASLGYTLPSWGPSCRRCRSCYDQLWNRASPRASELSSPCPVSWCAVGGHRAVCV